MDDSCGTTSYYRVMKGDPRETKRFQKPIPFSLLAAKRSFLRKMIALDNVFRLLKVPRKSVETGGHAKGLKENFPFSGVRPNSKLQNLVKLCRKKNLGCPANFG